MRILTLFCFILFSHGAMSEMHDLLLEDINGDQHTLGEYIGKGKWVVVNVWGTNCPYCRQELDDLIDFHEQHRDKDAIVVGLTLHWPGFGFPDREDIYYFALDFFIDYPLLMVDAETATKVIGKPVNMIPLTFFYNPDGELVLRLNGVITREQMEKVIAQKTSDYRIEWAEEIPPEFKSE